MQQAINLKAVKPYVLRTQQLAAGAHACLPAGMLLHISHATSCWCMVCCCLQGKHMSEQLVARYQAKQQLPVAIVRPSLVSAIAGKHGFDCATYRM
jgi:hypothetical protein